MRNLFLAICSLSFATMTVAAPPGVVVDYSPTKSKQYIGSPSLAVLPNGDYVASHDFFGPGTKYDTMLVFSSSDRGKTWAKRAKIVGQWWSTLFVHRDALYLIGTTKEYGHAAIRKSTDGGKTWTTPNDATNGLLLGEGKYHCAPVPMLIHDGRIWRAMEEYTGPVWGTFRSFVMSAPIDADLLNAKSWTSTNRLDRNTMWLNGTFASWLEGNVVVDPNGKVVNLLRVQQPNLTEKAALVRISADGMTSSFDPANDFVDVPGGAKKFQIRHDAKSGKYWALANTIPEEFRKLGLKPDKIRNTLSIITSSDLRTWAIRRDILQDPDTKTHGFQYPDWQFDGEDMIALVRTAHEEPDGTLAHNAHDANYLTFHRIANVRAMKSR